MEMLLCDWLDPTYAAMWHMRLISRYIRFLYKIFMDWSKNYANTKKTNWSLLYYRVRTKINLHAYRIKFSYYLKNIYPIAKYISDYSISEIFAYLTTLERSVLIAVHQFRKRNYGSQSWAILNDFWTIWLFEPFWIQFLNIFN